jgi:hypothetical protein
MPASGDSLDKPWLLSIIAEHVTQIANIASDNPIAHLCARPHGCEQLVFGDELTGMLD